MKTLLRKILAVAGMAVAVQAAAQVTFYEDQGFSGRSFTSEKNIGDFGRYGFSAGGASAVVSSGRWEVCEEARFGGRCVVLRPGRYDSLGAMGLNDGVGSMRAVSQGSRVDDSRYAPALGGNDYRRASNERLYQANVLSVRAVVGPPEQRCWIEREQVVSQRSNNSVPGTIAGAVLGGILGHQVGNGRGNDLATAGGAVAGAVVGNRLGSDSGGGQQVSSHDVQRCASTPDSARPDYWDVTYTFRGQEHRLQMNAPPGATVTVNERGEPRS